MSEFSEISSRKIDHIRICLSKNVEFRKSNGFERYQFNHHALPEIDFDSISLSAKFLKWETSIPFFIEALTGGAPGTERINRNLAIAAQKFSIGMGLGSQRAMLEDSSLSYTYQVREFAPDIFLLGNIGATQLIGVEMRRLVGLVEEIGADGLVIHLNPLQELIQPEGDKSWKNVLKAIENLCSKVAFPIVVKETGCGISGRIASRLEEAGVAAIDVAGAGGTSFARVEHYRGSKSADLFFEWGISTAESLWQCRQTVPLPLVASGGIKDGLDSAKALALGSSLVGIARPLLQAAVESSEKVIRVIERLVRELKMTMFLVGASDLRQLQQIGLSGV